MSTVFCGSLNNLSSFYEYILLLVLNRILYYDVGAKGISVYIL